MASDSRALTLKLLADVADYQKKLGDSQTATEGFSGKVQEFGKKAAVAFAAAGAAAAAYAGKLLVEGVQAAIADEAAQQKLATALKAVTGATNAQIKSTEDYITKTSLAFGVTDDELRPSLQRLAIATGDVTKAQNLQKIALDVSAGSGKALDTVTQALAKAYEGNNASLARLGIGLSAAELKTMSFDEVTASLAKTFEGQASVQADTLQGKITRLQVGFDEAKEAVGARLLPIITQFLTFVTDKLIPGAEDLFEKFKPITKAVSDNKEEFQALWNFLNASVVPILTGALKTGIQGIVTVITVAVEAVSKLVNAFQFLYDKFKQFVDFLKNNPLSKWLGSINPFSNSSFSQANFVTGGAATSQAFVGANSSINFADPFQNFFGSNIPDKRRFMGLFQQLQSGQFLSPLLEWQLEEALLGRRFDGTGDRPAVTINVNAPSVIDEEGFTRSVIDALNSSQARTGALGTLTL